MAITPQRHVPKASTDRSDNIQVDEGIDRGLLVCFDSSTATASNVEFNGVPLSFIGGGEGNSFWYLANPPVGTFALTYDMSNGVAVCSMAWVLNGVHQTNAPVFLLGTNGNPVVWSWSGRAASDFIACVASRRTASAWAAGGALSEDSETNYEFSAGEFRRVAAGSMLAGGDTPSPEFAFTDGESGSNLFGSAAWQAADDDPPAASSAATIAHLLNN